MTEKEQKENAKKGLSDEVIYKVDIPANRCGYILGFRLGLGFGNVIIRVNFSV